MQFYTQGHFMSNQFNVYLDSIQGYKSLMNTRERFLKTLITGFADHPPLFEDGIRTEVLRKWHNQGLKVKVKLEDLFVYDHREEIEPDLDPRPGLRRFPSTLDGLQRLQARLDPSDIHRLPDDWERKISEWKNRDYPLILRVHRGFYLTLGVYGWCRFAEANRLLVDDPRLVESWLNTYTDFTTAIAKRILERVQVDAVLFSEPIGGNHGPLISPKMYASVILKSYLPILDELKANGVKIIIYRTYANTRALLPAVVAAGFNCLWACECNPRAMDYHEIRAEFGKGLRLIGGIDSDALRQSREEIQRSVMEVVPALLEEGGYIPLADGRVREDVRFENYTYYRTLLETVAGVKESYDP